MKKNYTLILKTLSPVYIGCGKEISKIDYVYFEKSKKVYKINMVKFASFIESRKLMDVLRNRIAQADAEYSLTDFFKEKIITENEARDCSEYILDNNNISLSSSQMTINEFIKDAYGYPYVPGSSLKGAIRTAIAYATILDDRQRFDEIASKLRYTIKENKSNSKKIDEISKKLEQDIFHTLSRKLDREGNNKDILNDNMVGLIVGDSYPLSKDDIILCQKNDVFLDGNINKINVIRECIRPGTEIRFDISIDDKILRIGTKKADMETIINCCNSFFENYNTIFRKLFLENITSDFFTPQKGENDGFIYIGAGTGFPLKSLMYSLYSDVDEASELISMILDKAFPGANHKMFAEDTGISPKVLKCTEYNDKLYEMGICSVKYREV